MIILGIFPPEISSSPLPVNFAKYWMPKCWPATEKYKRSIFIYVDDLINKLHLSGYGAYLGKLFVGTIFYADDICLTSGSCFGLQKLLDRPICSNYGVEWDFFYLILQKVTFSLLAAEIMALPYISVVRILSGALK